MLLGFNILVTKSEIRDALEVRSVDVASLNETKISYQTCEVTFGWTQIVSQSSAYAASFLHCFKVANKFLPPIYQLFCCLFQY